jgi:hypothetical protein
LANERARGVTQQPFGQGIDLTDPTGLIDHEHGTRRQLQQAALKLSYFRFRQHDAFLDGSGFS